MNNRTTYKNKGAIERDFSTLFTNAYIRTTMRDLYINANFSGVSFEIDPAKRNQNISMNIQRLNAALDNPNVILQNKDKQDFVNQLFEIQRLDAVSDTEKQTQLKKIYSLINKIVGKGAVLSQDQENERVKIEARINEAKQVKTPDIIRREKEIATIVDLITTKIQDPLDPTKLDNQISQIQIQNRYREAVKTGFTDLQKAIEDAVDDMKVTYPSEKDYYDTLEKSLNDIKNTTQSRVSTPASPDTQLREKMAKEVDLITIKKQGNPGNASSLENQMTQEKIIELYKKAGQNGFTDIQQQIEAAVKMMKADYAKDKNYTGYYEHIEQSINKIKDPAFVAPAAPVAAQPRTKKIDTPEGIKEAFIEKLREFINKNPSTKNIENAKSLLKHIAVDKISDSAIINEVKQLQKSSGKIFGMSRREGGDNLNEHLSWFTHAFLQAQAQHLNREQFVTDLETIKSGDTNFKHISIDAVIKKIQNGDNVNLAEEKSKLIRNCEVMIKQLQSNHRSYTALPENQQTQESKKEIARFQPRVDALKSIINKLQAIQVRDSKKPNSAQMLIKQLKDVFKSKEEKPTSEPGQTPKFRR